MAANRRRALLTPAFSRRHAPHAKVVEATVVNARIVLPRNVREAVSLVTRVAALACVVVFVAAEDVAVFGAIFLRQANDSCGNRQL